jgi:hypothetical protein
LIFGGTNLNTLRLLSKKPGAAIISNIQSPVFDALFIITNSSVHPKQHIKSQFGKINLAQILKKRLSISAELFLMSVFERNQINHDIIF